MSTQRFVDALSGADGTQALRLRYDVPPVYPDATVPVDAVRPTVVTPVTIRIPEIDPRVARAVSELAAIDRPAAPRAARPGTRPPRAPAAPPPSRAQAARAGYYQGPTPTAVAPAAPARHLQAPPAPIRPAAPLGASAGNRLMSQLNQFGQQFGTGNSRTPPAAPSFPQSGPRSSVPPMAFQPPAPPPRRVRRTANTVQLVLFVIVFLLITTGLGGKIIDAVTTLIQR